MGYERVLNLSLIPTTLFFLLSLVSIVITAHYWIIGDWLMPRWIAVPTTFNQRTNSWNHDDMIVDYTEPSTNATIISGCLCLTAAVMAGIAWHKLRKRDMDSDFQLPVRRFYTGTVFITGAAAVGAALAALVTSFTDKGPDQYGCTVSTASTKSAGTFTNLLCSREMGACNFLKKWVPLGTDRSKDWTAPLACNEIIAVKWLQIVLIVNAVVVMAMFGLQARLRKKTRWTRAGKQPLVNPM